MIDTKIYRDIAARTDGAFMLGVVGPVRTGKSTFIKRFMETMVIPEIENTYTRERARDELPQSGSGRTIMTAEPKFIPEEAVRLSLDGCELSVRLVDCVGYMVEGAAGQFENGVETDIILYLGLCNGAGWATSLDGRDAVLLGIEKIIELNWQDESAMQALIFHEIGHIWHKTYGNLYPEARSEGENSLAQLYQEGLAMVCEHILCQDDRYYHQNQNGWLDWCKENEAEIKREYLRRVDKNISTQDFFGDWCSYKNHSDVGYYLGCEFVKYLQRQYSLVDIASLNVNQLYNHFKEFASAE